MYLREEARNISSLLLDVVDALTQQAAAHPEAPMPGRTHLQNAQMVLLGPSLLAHALPLLQDIYHHDDWDKRAAISPSSSGALARSSFGLDPPDVATEHGSPVLSH